MNWIINQSGDFILVCHLAGRNCRYVYESVIKRIKKRQKNIDDIREGKIGHLLREDRNNDLSKM